MQCDLVLEGGGVKGIALVGAVDVLEEHGYAVQRVAGTSAGAIVGALVAAGLPRERRAAVMREVDYSRFQDGSLLTRVPGGKLLALVRRQGVYRGDHLREWLADQLAGCGVTTFADLALPDDAGAARAPGDRWRLLVMASDVTHGALRCLPRDYPALGCPDPSGVAVADAVRASMSIPLFYRPVRLPGADGGRITLVDGGMLSNFPVAVFDRRDGREPRWPTFGIKLSARPGTQRAPLADRGLVGMVRAMVATMTGFYDQMHLDDPAVRARTVFVDTFGVKATDFDLDAETREALYRSGRDAMERFLATWDFERYKAEHRRPAEVVLPSQPGAADRGRTATPG